MNERHERIEELLERYFEAQTTDAEERELRDYFRQECDIPTSLHYAQALFCGLEELSAERMPEPTSEPIYSDVRMQTRSMDIAPNDRPPVWRSPQHRLSVIWGAVAASVLLVGIFIGLERLRQPYCYIDGVAVYNKQVALQTTAYLDGFAGFTDPALMVEELMRNE